MAADLVVAAVTPAVAAADSKFIYNKAVRPSSFAAFYLLVFGGLQGLESCGFQYNICISRLLY